MSLNVGGKAILYQTDRFREDYVQKSPIFHIWQWRHEDSETLVLRQFSFQLLHRILVTEKELKAEVNLKTHHFFKLSFG